MEKNTDEEIFKIANNVFEYNSALAGANALHLRVVGKDDILDYNNTLCSGYMIDSNNFTKNVGCQDTYGAIYVYCIDPNKRTTANLSSGLIYDENLDQQSFNGSLYDEKLIDQSYDKKIVLMNNFYDRNLAGPKRSIVNIEGFPAIDSIGELYEGNIGWTESNFENSAVLNRDSEMKEP